MRYDDPNTELLFLSFREWCAERNYAASESAFEKLAEFVFERGGVEPALSLWDRAAQELGIRLKKIAQPQPIPADFAETIQLIHPSDLRVKLNRDPAFAEMYGRWAAGERPEGTVVNTSGEVDPYANLTATQWRSLPPVTASRLMLQPNFRAAVQRLIDRGEI